MEKVEGAPDEGIAEFGDDDEGEDKKDGRGQADLKAGIVVGTGDAGSKAPFGREELEDVNKVVAESESTADPLIDPDKFVLDKGGQPKNTA